MKKKSLRLYSFIIIIAVYVVATVAAILLYRLIDVPFWLGILIADVAATVIVFVFSCIFDNASVYYPYWSVQPIVILYALATQANITLFRALLLIVVSIWGVRLTANWAVNFSGMDSEDWRYRQYKANYPKIYPLLNNNLHSEQF